MELRLPLLAHAQATRLKVAHQYSEQHQPVKGERRQQAGASERQLFSSTLLQHGSGRTDWKRSLHLVLSISQLQSVITSITSISPLPALLQSFSHSLYPPRVILLHTHPPPPSPHCHQEACGESQQLCNHCSSAERFGVVVTCWGGCLCVWGWGVCV